MENLAQMRVEEGRAMAADLAANCRAIAARLEQIAGGRRWWPTPIARGWKSG